MTLDGSISDPQTWCPPYWDDEHTQYTQSPCSHRQMNLLLGRVTYEGFAEAWPPRSGDEFADRINNAMPKYVAVQDAQ